MGSGFPGLVTAWLHVGGDGVTGCGWSLKKHGRGASGKRRGRGDRRPGRVQARVLDGVAGGAGPAGRAEELLADGVIVDGARPLLRVTAHVRTATFRWGGAAIRRYHDGENALADQLEGSFRPGMLNLADRGFFSMDRFLRFPGTGSHLAWRVKDRAKAVPS